MIPIVLGTTVAVMGSAPMTYVTHINTAVPKHALSQSQVASMIAETLKVSADRLPAYEELFRHAQVKRRFSVLDREALSSRRSLSQSMELYRLHAAELGLKAAKACLAVAEVSPRDIDMVVTCSCTGLLLPSLSVVIAKELGLRNDVRRIPITEAGCAGGASALARADEFVRAFPEARALVLAVELPTLTFQGGDNSRANLVASAIFGDGAAAAIVEGSGVLRHESAGVEIIATHSEVLPDSQQDLGFDLRDGGLHIVLTQHVPQVISEHLPRIVEDFLKVHGLVQRDLSFLVLHPGGAKVLKSIETCLQLSPGATQVSHDILRDFGNQSSASVLFVLQQSMSQGLVKGYGLLAAFGPGITVELSLLRGQVC